MQPQRTRIQELDALRLIAAIAVVFYHLTYYKNSSLFPEVDWLTRYGYLGVELFFMISGFVILWSTQGRTAWQFGVSRFARLYPLFWIAMLLTSLVVTVTPMQFIANATMIAGYLGQEYIDGVYWTLQVELKFYVLIGLLLLFKQGQRLEAWIAGWTLASIMAEFLPILRSIVIYPYSPLFIGGGICFLIRSKGLSFTRMIMYLAALFLAVKHAGPLATGFVSDAGVVPAVLTTGIFAVMFALAVGRVPLRCSPALAAMTYPLYLVHNMIGRWIAGYLGNGWFSLTLALVVVTALAYVLSLLDQPLGNRIKRAAARFQLAIAPAKHAD